jgi:hypothetical protein
VKIYVSHSTKFYYPEAQALLNRAALTNPTPQWTKRQLGCGKHVERQAVAIWDATHCWILRPDEARAWGNQPPTHTGSRYQAYKLRLSRKLIFTPQLTWSIPAKVSTTLHAQATAYRDHILKERARAKAYRAKKKALCQ